MPFAPQDAADTQGLLRAGYGSLPDACFVLLRIADPGAARAWLAAAPITSMADLDTLRTTALNLALSQEGLRALHLSEPVMAGFSAEFLSGMAGDDGRSRRMGDVGTNDPAHWDWGVGARAPHLVLLIYAAAGGLAAWQQQLMMPPWDRAFSVLQTLPTAALDAREPFGFVDGVSQPVVDWTGTPDPSEAAHETYSNLIAVGEMLLGYPNEYGKYTQRPLIAPAAAADTLLPTAEDRPELHDLGRNGTYLVLRQLRQDVTGFWRYMDRQTAGNPAARVALAEAIVGRHMSGEPLLPGGTAIPGVGPDTEATRRNGFTYAADTTGLNCPFGAHVRRANPRNADLPVGTHGVLNRLWWDLGLVRQQPRDDLIASTRFHRILRRGRDYGAQATPDEALATTEPLDAGLHFACLNANIARQFEFVQGAWLAGIAFDGLTGERDPLTAPREGLLGGVPADTFSLPQPSGLMRRIEGLPQFVTVRGGAYFFMPGLRALRWIATA